MHTKIFNHKLKLSKQQKIQKHFARLKKYYNQPFHLQKTLLWVCLICLIIFSFFSLMLIGSNNLITNGYVYLNQNYLFNEDANYLPLTKDVVFNLGIYHYIIHLKSAVGNSLSSLMQGSPSTLSWIIGNYVGPVVTWYGIVYLICAGLVILLIIACLINFSIYHKFLKYTVKSIKKTRRYFHVVYILMLIFSILCLLIVVLNVTPGSSLVELLLAKFAPQFHYPVIHSSSNTSSSSINVNQYLSALSVGGSGLSLPIALFAFIHVKFVMIANVTYLAAMVYLPFWTYLVIAIVVIYVNIMLSLLIISSDWYDKQKQIVLDLIHTQIFNNEIANKILKKYS